MGTGMTVGSLCGAVNAAAMIVGYIKGRENNGEANEARGYARELMSRVRGKFNSEKMCIRDRMSTMCFFTN